MNNTKTIIIKVHGKNIDNFFQNIITNNIKKLDDNNSLYTALLSPQGKYLHDFIIVKNNDDYLLETNADNSADLVKEIKKYDLRNEIQINVKKTLITKVILQENLNKFYLNKILDKKIFRAKNYTFFTDPRSENFLYRFWIAKDFSIELDHGFSSQEEVEKKRIERNIPNSSQDLIYNKSFILNYNFDNINAISFDKGCYIGQENTAKQKYRGKLKYLLQTIKIINGPIPKINQDIFHNNMKIGTMKSRYQNLCLCLLRNEDELMKSELIVTDTNMSFKIL